MKLAFVVHTVYPDFIGGREHHVHHLARAFARDHDVIVVGGGRVAVLTEEKVDGYRLLRLPTKGITLSTNPLQIYRFIRGVGILLEKECPDIVHAFEYGSQSTDMAFSYARKKNIPFFVTVYGYTLVSPVLRYLKTFYDLFWGRHILEGARRIYCVSQTQYQDVIRITKKPVFKNTIEILANGITFDDFKDIDIQMGQACAGLDGSCVNLTVAARLLPRKNISSVIRALHKVVYVYKIDNVKLTIVGPDCGSRPHIEALIATLGMRQFVDMHGVVPYCQMKGILTKSDIFVLPSIYEGLSLALLEAMACGRAVVFSDIPAARSVITPGEDGILVDPLDISGLADALVLLIKDRSLRIRLGRNAASKAASFDILLEKNRMQKHYTDSVLGVS